MLSQGANCVAVNEEILREYDPLIVARTKSKVYAMAERAFTIRLERWVPWSWVRNEHLLPST